MSHWSKNVTLVKLAHVWARVWLSRRSASACLAIPEACLSILLYPPAVTSCCCTIPLYHTTVPSTSLTSYFPTTFLVHHFDELMYNPARPASIIRFECNTVPLKMCSTTEFWMCSWQNSCHFRSVYQGNPVQVLPYFQQLVQPVLSMFPPGWSWGI